MTAVTPQSATFGGPALPLHQHPGHSMRRWWWDRRKSATSPCAKEESPARATVELPRRGATMRAASSHPTTPLAIHLPILTAESFNVPHTPRPVGQSAFGRTLWGHCRCLLGMGFIPVLPLPWFHEIFYYRCHCRCPHRRCPRGGKVWMLCRLVVFVQSPRC